MCFRCNAFNPFGDSNANIDLNFDTGAENEQQTNGQSAAVAAAASQVISNSKSKIQHKESLSQILRD